MIPTEPSTCPFCGKEVRVGYVKCLSCRAVLPPLPHVTPTIEEEIPLPPSIKQQLIYYLGNWFCGVCGVLSVFMMVMHIHLTYQTPRFRFQYSMVCGLLAALSVVSYYMSRRYGRRGG